MTTLQLRTLFWALSRHPNNAPLRTGGSMGMTARDGRDYAGGADSVD